MQITGITLMDGIVHAQGIFHPDVRPASMVITQAFAWMGLSAGAAFYALRKMGVPPHYVHTVRLSGGDVFVDFTTAVNR